MATIIVKRGTRRFISQIMVNGVKRAKLFPDASMESKRAAMQWELETRKRLEQESTATRCLSIIVWIDEYLDEVQARYSQKTYEEKRKAFSRFIKHSGYAMETPVEEIKRDAVRGFLRHLSKKISGHAANKARKNIGAAWRWGERNIEGWPHVPNHFLTCERFKEQKSIRYIPPEEDFWKVYAFCEKQDQVMLLAFFHLGARRNELFSLKWSEVDFNREQVYLQTRKRDGGLEGNWVPMTKQLCRELAAWFEERQSMMGMDPEHVFVILANTAFCEDYYGKPFQKRQHFMEKLCTKAGVKPFGFHSIRHLFASRLWRKNVALGHIQQLLRHQSPRTTERYLKSLGLDTIRKSLQMSFNPSGDDEPSPR